MNISILHGYIIEEHNPVEFEVMPPHKETYFENATTDLGINNITYYQCNKAYKSDILVYTDNLTIFVIERRTVDIAI